MLSNFAYIKTPEFTGNIIQDANALLCSNNKQETFNHIKAVAETNMKIADKYELDRGLCELCGYLHDISTVIPPDDMLSYAVKNGMFIDEAEKRYPFLLHQRMSRLIAEQDFNVTDERILSAIECHSTLKTEPTAYDMALFIADKLSWDKDGLPPFYDVVYKALDKSLEAASLAYMEYIIEHKMMLYPHKWFNEGMDYLTNTPDKI